VVIGQKKLESGELKHDDKVWEFAKDAYNYNEDEFTHTDEEIQSIVRIEGVVYTEEEVSAAEQRLKSFIPFLAAAMDKAKTEPAGEDGVKLAVCSQNPSGGGYIVCTLEMGEFIKDLMTLTKTDYQSGDFLLEKQAAGFRINFNIK
jgi:hypothetical protein